MKKISLYTFSFLLASSLFFVIVSIFLGSILLIVSFITWSWPIETPFTWLVFRIIASIAAFFALAWSFSKENKEWVDGVMKDLTEGKK
jgi:hypothetical protein